jgi:hypothetical protein
MARLGRGGLQGIGRNLQFKGFHPTSVLGRFGAAAVASVVLGLSEERTAHALGVAATTAGGLTASFGTMSKPFHAGKAAMDGILAAQLAAEGFEAATHLLDADHGLQGTFIQDRSVRIPPVHYDDGWELLRNGFKPYACCRSIHPAVDAARQLASRVNGKAVEHVHVKVHKNATVPAPYVVPATPLQASSVFPSALPWRCVDTVSWLQISPLHASTMRQSWPLSHGSKSRKSPTRNAGRRTSTSGSAAATHCMRHKTSYVVIPTTP